MSYELKRLQFKIHNSLDLLHESKLAPLLPPSPEGTPCPPKFGGNFERASPSNWGTGGGEKVFMQEVYYSP